MLIGHLCIIFVIVVWLLSLGKCLFKSFSHFKIGLFGVLVVSCRSHRSPLCILYINPLIRHMICKYFLSVCGLLFQSLCMFVCVYDYADSFATPRTVAHQELSVHGFSRQEYWSGLPVPPPGDLPDPRIKSVSLMY